MKHTVFGSWNIHFALLPESQGSITVHQLAPGIGEPVFQHQSRHTISTGVEETALQQLSAIAAHHLSTTIAQAKCMLPVYQYFSKVL